MLFVLVIDLWHSAFEAKQLEEISTLKSYSVCPHITWRGERCLYVGRDWHIIYHPKPINICHATENCPRVAVWYSWSWDSSLKQLHKFNLGGNYEVSRARSLTVASGFQGSVTWRFPSQPSACSWKVLCNALGIVYTQPGRESNVGKLLMKSFHTAIFEKIAGKSLIESLMFHLFVTNEMWLEMHFAFIEICSRCKWVGPDVSMPTGCWTWIRPLHCMETNSGPAWKTFRGRRWSIRYAKFY
jgi:hypothetical protein